MAVTIFVAVLTIICTHSTAFAVHATPKHVSLHDKILIHVWNGALLTTRFPISWKFALQRIALLRFRIDRFFLYSIREITKIKGAGYFDLDVIQLFFEFRHQDKRGDKGKKETKSCG